MLNFRPEISAAAKWIWPHGPSTWAACKQTLVTDYLFATCDNVMKIYFDGIVALSEDNDWTITTKIVIPSGTKVVGIQCKDLGGYKGILASSPSGMVTDEGWQCSANENLVGWSDPGFIDASGDFSSPTSYGVNGVGPWGSR